MIPMRPYFPRRQALLFLIAILVPCAVLVVLGLRLMDQERQLEVKRLSEERQLLVDQVGQELLLLLEKIKLGQLTKMAAREPDADHRQSETAIAFVGTLVDGSLRLPWENNPDAQRFRTWLNEGSFATTILEAEKLEAKHQYERAARQYREALTVGPEPAQRTYARLGLARTLQKLARRQESQLEFGRVLASSPELVDEHGVPLGLYAAQRLLQDSSRQAELVNWIRLAADRDRLWPPVALRMTCDLAAELGRSDLLLSLDELIRDREQAEALQADLAHMMQSRRNREPVWMPYGDPTLLVSVTRPVGNSDGLVIAVRGTEILKQLSTQGVSIRLASEGDADGKPLGESFPGLRVIIPAPQPQKIGSRQTFLVCALSLALGFTLVAGYLLWRDVQRDLRLAEMRSQFVSSVTHELKTPLTAIRMFTETLRLDEEVDRQTRFEYLDTILHESERLSRLVDNVLDFGKIERGKKTYRFQPVQLHEVVEEAARAAQYPLEQAGFALEVATEPNLPPVSADSDALQQAILNLLTNAMKYSGDSRRIGLRLDRENGNARIQVVDEGVGISPEGQVRIFERFYRAPTAENQHIPGTGLGLTIVAHIAKAHGGGVDVVSRLGSGSSFTIHLPLPEAERV